MKRATVSLAAIMAAFLSPTALFAQSSYPGLSVSISGGTGIVSSAYAGLGAASDGTIKYCTDCATTSPCSDGGSGAYAFATGGAWDCSLGIPGITDPGGDGLVARTGSSTAARTITAGTGLSCTNGDGVSGNPTCGPDRTMIPFRGSGSGGVPPSECGDTGDAYQLGDLYFDTTNAVLFACYKIDFWFPVTQNSSVALVTEEFLGSQSATGNQIGQLGWASQSIGSGSTFQINPGDANHPGALYWPESAANDGMWVRTVGLNGNFYTARDWNSTFTVIPNSTPDGIDIYVGWMDNVPASMAAGIYAMRSTTLGHSTWVFAICDSATTGCNSAGDATNQDSNPSTITPANAQADTVRVWHRNAGVGGISTIYFSVNGETPITFCASGCTSTMGNLPSADIYPGVTFINQSGASEAMKFDFYQFASWGFTR